MKLMEDVVVQNKTVESKMDGIVEITTRLSAASEEIKSIVTVIQQIASMEELSSSAMNLNQVAENLNIIANKFKV